jgi:hypothetical protein
MTGLPDGYKEAMVNQNSINVGQGFSPEDYSSTHSIVNYDTALQAGIKKKTESRIISSMKALDILPPG